MSKGWMYILKCANGAFYTGSTKNLELRIQQHQDGEGANFTKKHGPVELVYHEEYQRIDQAFYREKQVQGWSRKKKQALIDLRYSDLPSLSKNYSQDGTSTSSDRRSLPGR
jgi:putative endonuclease